MNLTPDLLQELKDTIALLDSMVEGGEKHSQTSRDRIKNARGILNAALYVSDGNLSEEEKQYALKLTKIC